MQTQLAIASPRYGEPTLIRPRLGQGAFRASVTSVYQHRCALTGERTLPILDAAHIRPYDQGGEHEVTNGLLLRTDIHRLFDKVTRPSAAMAALRSGNDLKLNSRTVAIITPCTVNRYPCREIRSSDPQSRRSNGTSPIGSWDNGQARRVMVQHTTPLRLTPKTRQ